MTTKAKMAGLAPELAAVITTEAATRSRRALARNCSSIFILLAVTTIPAENARGKGLVRARGGWLPASGKVLQNTGLGLRPPSPSLRTAHAACVCVCLKMKERM